MEPQHHNKIVITCGIALVLIAIILGIVVVKGKKQKLATPPPVVDEYQRLVEATSGTGEPYSIDDPEVQKMIKATSGTGGSGSASDREALIKATSGN